MQAVASEMNLSETAFLLPEDDGYRLRWFTPKMEVDLCGHATLASAHVLWTEGRVPAASTINFHTDGGLLKAARQSRCCEGNSLLRSERIGQVACNSVEIREMTAQDYDDVAELWRNTEGVGLSEGDTKEEITAYLARNFDNEPGEAFWKQIGWRERGDLKVLQKPTPNGALGIQST